MDGSDQHTKKEAYSVAVKCYNKNDKVTSQFTSLIISSKNLREIKS